LGIVDKAVVATLVLVRLVVSEFEITDSFGEVSSDACTIDVEVGEDGLGKGVVEASGGFPVALIEVEGIFVIVNIFIKPCGDL